MVAWIVTPLSVAVGASQPTETPVALDSTVVISMSLAGQFPMTGAIVSSTGTVRDQYEHFFKFQPHEPNFVIIRAIRVRQIISAK